MGIYYTGYYIGMTAGPVLAGWTRDATGSAAAPVLLGAAMLACVVLSVVGLRILQRAWPITENDPS